MSETLEREIYTVPVSQLVGLFLRFFDLGIGAHSLGRGFGKLAEAHHKTRQKTAFQTSPAAIRITRADHCT